MTPQYVKQFVPAVDTSVYLGSEDTQILHPVRTNA